VITTFTVPCTCTASRVGGARASSERPPNLDERTAIGCDRGVDSTGDRADPRLRRYHTYYPHLLDPHINTAIFKPNSPHWYSWHGVGLSALLVPAVAIADTHGATVMMVGVAALVLLLTFLWARRFTGESLYAVIATGALAVSPFFLGLEGRIFGDLVRLRCCSAAS